MKYLPILLSGVLCVARLHALGTAEVTAVAKRFDSPATDEQYQARMELNRLVAQATLPGKGDPVAVTKVLVTVLQSPDTSDEAAKYMLRSLARVATADAVEPLAKILAGENEMLGEEARAALSWIQDPKAAAALEAALTKSSDKRGKRGLIAALASQKSASSVPLLAPLVFDPDPDLSRDAIDALARIGGVPVVSSITAAHGSDKLQAALKFEVENALLGASSGGAKVASEIYQKTTFDSVRHAAFIALMKNAEESARPALIEVALKSKDAGLRHAALARGIELNLPTLSSSLARSIGQMPKEDRLIVLANIHHLKPAEAAEKIAVSCVAATEEDERIAAIGALGRIGTKGAFDALFQAVGAREPRINQAAANALSSMTYPEAASRLLSILKGNNSPEKILAIKAMNSVQVPDAGSVLIDITKPVRCAASDSGGLYYYRYAQPGEPTTIECDVAVYGGTPAGVTAAIEAARMGRKTVLLSFNRHVGGLTSGGLTATDIGTKSSIGGLALEFYGRLNRISDFRPSEAEALMLKMLDEAGVKVLFERCLESVVTKDGRLISITMETAETIKAAMFIDATYEGDLLAAAKVSYHVGREPANSYGESLAGQWQQVSWKGVYQFCEIPLSPYVQPGNPASGLLPEISTESPGKPGEGDLKVQAYNFRIQLTDKQDKVPFPKPPVYDPGRYALLARFLNADQKVRWTLNYTTTPMTDGPVQIRNGDCNNAGSFSSDYIGGNYQWPDGTYEPGSFTKMTDPRRGVSMPLRKLYEIRERIFQDHVNYQQGLMFFLANDAQVPEELRNRVNQFGLDPREFQNTGFWPHQLYIREGRRMVSSYVITQADCESETTVNDSVGLASYPMDSHFCQRVVVEESGKTTMRNEGGFGHPCPKPYPVSYRAIVPHEEECFNLLVPVCLSSSHVAYGSIRMEPVFMILGQSAGAAASMAITDKVSVQKVDYTRLKVRLLAGKQRL